MLQNSNAALLAKGITWLVRTRLGLSFLLAFASWIALVECWTRTHEGSAVFKLIAALIRPGMSAGSYVAAMFFGNNPEHRAATFLMEVGGVLVMYTAFWYAVITAIHRVRPKKLSGSFSQPEA